MAGDLGGRQKRALNGAGITAVGGGGVAVAVAAAAATVIHTLNLQDPENGGPLLDEITLYVINKSGTARIVQVFLDGVIIWEGSIPAVTGLNATQIFDGQPMKRPSTTAAGVISIQAANGAGATDIYCWGWFVRG